MYKTKFTIGQLVKHKLLDRLGVIIDVDPAYSLSTSHLQGMNLNRSLLNKPWYYVVMENDQGQTIHTYQAEALLESEQNAEHPNQPYLDELSCSVIKQFSKQHLRH